MKVGDEVYLREDSEWNDGFINNPIGVKGKIVEININETFPINVSWGDCINDYKESDLILASEYGVPAMNQGHPNADILMEIAKEAAINKEYWKEFEAEYTDFDHKQKWESVYESGLLSGIYEGRKIRRKPRTIRIGNYDVTEPSEISIKHFDNSNSVLIDFDNVENARSMLKALRELLGAKK